MELEEYDYPYDSDSYADFCGSSYIETSIKIFEDSIKAKDKLLFEYKEACNCKTGFPDFLTSEDIEIELMEMRQNPPQYLPEDEAMIIPNWYMGIRHLAWRMFKEEKVQRFIIPSRDFLDSSCVGELLPKIEGIYIVWAGDYDYLTAKEQVLLYIGKSINISVRWRRHHQAEYIAREAQDLDLYKVYIDCIPISSLAFSLRVSEIIFLETLKPVLKLNQRF